MNTINNIDCSAWWSEWTDQVSSLSTHIQKQYQFGEVVFCANFYQNEIDFFTCAIGHNEVNNHSYSDFNIDIIDFSECEGNFSWNRWFIDKYKTNFDNNHFLISDNGNFVIHLNTSEDGLILQMINKSANRAILCYSSLSAIPEWERSFPFRQIIHHYFENSEYCLIHAASVGNNENCVLITAKGGSGKSTSALASLVSGLSYLGDDFVLVNTETLEVYSLYNVAKVELHQLEIFPNLEELIANKVSKLDKFQLFLYPKYKPQLKYKLKLRAILVPNYNSSNPTTYLKSTSAANVLLNMAPTTIFLLKSNQKVFQLLSDLCRKVPLYSLHTSKNISTIPQKILELL